MTVWQYAQLRVTYEDRLAASGNWTIAWYGPDASTQHTAEVYNNVVAELNNAGTQGWELVNVAVMDAGDSRHLSSERDWSLTRYTFRRPQDLTAAKRAEPTQRGETPIRISPPHPLPAPDDVLAGSMTADRGTLVTLTAYWLPDREPADRPTGDRDRGPAPGRLLISRKEGRPRSQADMNLIKFFRLEYEAPDVTPERRERIKVAAADYAASWLEGRSGVTWWLTPQRLLLSQAADVLDGSADWLRGLVEDPLTAAVSRAGVTGPMVPIGAGITAYYVAAPLTGPLEDAARICEIAGIVIGLATGAHPLVIACAKRLAHDEAGQMLSGAFDQVITSIDAGHDSPADPGRDTKLQSPESSQLEEEPVWPLGRPPLPPAGPSPSGPSGRPPLRPAGPSPSGPSELEEPGPSGRPPLRPAGPSPSGPSGPGVPGV